MKQSYFVDQYGAERRRALRKMQRAMARRELKDIARDVNAAGGNLLGTIVTGLLLGIVVIAVMRVPVLDAQADEKAQRLAEAKMKARLFTKYPDPLLAEGERLTFPVSSYPKDHK